MLRGCRRVLRPAGRLAFLTIQATTGLTTAQRRKAHRIGPPATALRSSYERMLRTAGFREIEATDCTAEYQATQRRWVEAYDRYEPDVRAAIGDDAFDERALNRDRTRQAIEHGLLSRFLYTARR